MHIVVRVRYVYGIFRLTLIYTGSVLRGVDGSRRVEVTRCARQDEGEGERPTTVPLYGLRLEVEAAVQSVCTRDRIGHARPAMS